MVQLSDPVRFNYKTTPPLLAYKADGVAVSVQVLATDVVVPGMRESRPAGRLVTIPGDGGR